MSITPLRSYVILDYLIARLHDEQTFTVADILKELDDKNAGYHGQRSDSSLWATLKGDGVKLALSKYGGKIVRSGFVKAGDGPSRVAILKVVPSFLKSVKPVPKPEELDEVDEWL